MSNQDFYDILADPASDQQSVEMLSAIGVNRFGEEGQSPKLATGPAPASIIRELLAEMEAEERRLKGRIGLLVEALSLEMVEGVDIEIGSVPVRYHFEYTAPGCRREWWRVGEANVFSPEQAIEAGLKMAEGGQSDG